MWYEKSISCISSQLSFEIVLVCILKLDTKYNSAPSFRCHQASTLKLVTPGATPGCFTKRIWKSKSSAHWQTPGCACTLTKAGQWLGDGPPAAGMVESLAGAQAMVFSIRAARTSSPYSCTQERCLHGLSSNSRNTYRASCIYVVNNRNRDTSCTGLEKCELFPFTPFYNSVYRIISNTSIKWLLGLKLT